MSTHTRGRFAVPPGQHLLDELKAHKIRFSEFKKRVPELTTERDLENGATVITAQIAAAIGEALGMEAKIWVDLEEEFRREVSDGAPILDDSSIDAAQAKAASGKLLLRLPSSLHRRATEAAKVEGISLNQLLLAYIAEGLGRTESTRSAHSE